MKVATAFLLAIALTGPLGAQRATPGRTSFLVTAAPWKGFHAETAALSAAVPAEVIQTVAVVPNYSALSAASFDMELGGNVYTATSGPREERLDGGFFQQFTVPEAPATSFVTYFQGSARGVIVTPDGAMLFEAGSQGVRLVKGVPSLACDLVGHAPNGARTEAVTAAAGRRHAAAPVVPPEFQPTVVRIMYAVCPESFAAAGGGTEIQAEAQAFVDQLTVIARDSGYPKTRFELAGILLTTIVPAGDSAKDLDAVAKDQNVRVVRKQYGADLVGFMTEADNGGAYSPSGFEDFSPDKGFFVFPRAYSLLSFTHAHEAGHTMGMKHNIENAGVPSEIPWAYGFHNDQGKIQDVMGVYTSPAGLVYSRVPLYSTTSTMWQGKMAIGGEASNNAKLLDHTAVGQYHSRLP